MDTKDIEIATLKARLKTVESNYSRSIELLQVAHRTLRGYHFRFLQLPREIRDRIYYYCIVPTEGIVIYDLMCPQSRSPQTNACRGLSISKRPPRALLLSSRQINAEVVETLVKLAVVTVALHGHCHTGFLRFSLSQELRNLRHIRVIIWSGPRYMIRLLKMLHNGVRGYPCIRTVEVIVRNRQSKHHFVKPPGRLVLPGRNIVRITWRWFDDSADVCTRFATLAGKARVRSSLLGTVWTREAGSTEWNTSTL